jgi:lysophospholipase L1-like esterase
MSRKLLITLVSLLLLALVLATHGCRRVTLVGDSLLGCARDTLVDAINSNNGESWVYTEYVKGGCTSYNNPINEEIYSKGMEVAFDYPDVVVLSFGTNDMSEVTQDKISFDSAVQSLQTLINQAVIAGANCIVMLESSHRFRADLPLNSRFEMHMDDWFSHWHSQTGDNEYLGIPYKLLIADISDTVEGDIDAYIGDYIHFNEAGAQLAAEALVEQINLCPEGRWIFGENTLQPDANYPDNPYLPEDRAHPADDS